LSIALPTWSKAACTAGKSRRMRVPEAKAPIGLAETEVAVRPMHSNAERSMMRIIRTVIVKGGTVG
jgi:hypothetical protein